MTPHAKRSRKLLKALFVFFMQPNNKINIAVDICKFLL